MNYSMVGVNSLRYTTNYYKADVKELDNSRDEDIHRVYPHTKTFAGAALHKCHCRLLAMKEVVFAEYVAKINKIVRS